MRSDLNIDRPLLLTEAISAGIWSDPGSNVLNAWLGIESDPLELCETWERMEAVALAMATGGYADDPTFCMVRDPAELVAQDDPRLVLRSALVIAAARYPGDDVFVVLDLTGSGEDPDVLWFDWSRPEPTRWRPVAKLSELVASFKLGAL